MSQVKSIPGGLSFLARSGCSENTSAQRIPIASIRPMGREAVTACQVERKELVQPAFWLLNPWPPLHGASNAKATRSEHQNQGFSIMNMPN